jgi:hypothetical protein
MRIFLHRIWKVMTGTDSSSRYIHRVAESSHRNTDRLEEILQIFREIWIVPAEIEIQ